jgi:hypothetical protein
VGTVSAATFIIYHNRFVRCKLYFLPSFIALLDAGCIFAYLGQAFISGEN